MPSPYRPLYLIEQDQSLRGQLRRFFSARTPRAEHIEQQMALRTAFPDEAWGGEGLRRDVAKRISEIIADVIGWPNPNFQPEDPMDKVLFNYCWDEGWMDGCEIEGIVYSIEQMLKIDLTDEEYVALREGTFGEAVDALIAKSPDAAACLRQSLPRTFEGPGALEAEHCQTLAAFLDVRDYLAVALRMERRSLRPTTRIRHLVRGRARRDMDRYVSTRFGVGSCLTPHRYWRRVLTTGLWTIMTLAILKLFYPVFFIADATAIVVLVGFFVAAITSLFKFCVAVGRLPEAFRMAKYRVRTLGDLVECICAERARAIGPTQVR